MKIFSLALLLFPCIASAQYFSEPHYPQHAFRDPLDIPITLAGNFGELRPGHFHSGIDIKTEGRIGLPVYAAAAGYVSRVGVSDDGYGNVIYICHPNGYTTVYGHLNRFNPALAKYVKDKEYAIRQWAVNLDLAPGLFPVKQGQLIAWSGSTGDAVAPHLHFEIRNTQTSHPLNAMLFGLTIQDHIPPEVFEVAVYDRSRSIYLQDPQIVRLKKNGSGYGPADGTITVPWRHAGFGVNTIDRQDGTYNTYGIYEAVLIRDGRPDIGVQMDNIGYDQTRYVDAHVDYRTKILGGPYFQLLFSLPGNHLDIYHSFGGDGDLDLGDGKDHQVTILVSDASGNTSHVNLVVRQGPGSVPAEPDCRYPMEPGVVNRFDTTSARLSLGPGELYDKICFTYSDQPAGPGMYSDQIGIHTDEVPLFGPYTLYLKPNGPIAATLRNKLVVVRQGHGGREVEPASWQGDWLAADFRNFGSFSVQADDVGPLIRPLRLRPGANLARAKQIAFRISDNLSGVKQYSAELDGKWLMFARKGNLIWYDFDDHCSRGNHTLILTVTDAVQNQSKFILHFKR